MNNEPTVTPPPQVASPTPSAPVKPASRNPVPMVIAAVAVVIIAALLWVFVFAGPSQADFKQAKDTAQEASNLYNDIDNDLKKYVNSSTSFDDDVESTLSSYKDSVNELRGMKAFKEEEAKKLYDEFVAKNEKFLAFVDGFVQSKGAFRDATENCSASQVSGS